MLRPARLIAAVVAGVTGTLILPLVPAQAHGATCTVTSAAAAIDGEEQQFLTLINQYRVSNGRNPLTISHAATRAASWFSWDMATDNYLPPDHVDTNGRDIPSRLSWCGVNYTSWAENIYAGNGTAQAAFDWWKNSAAHNTNMLSTAVTRIGIARHFNGSSTFGWYWTTDFVTETSSADANGFTWYDDGASSKSGPAGTTVRAYGTGALAGVTYQLVLATSGCASIVAVLNTSVRTATSSGFLSQTAGTIPSGVANGTYFVCFKDTANRTLETFAVPTQFTKT